MFRKLLYSVDALYRISQADKWIKNHNGDILLSTAYMVTYFAPSSKYNIVFVKLSFQSKVLVGRFQLKHLKNIK